MARPRPLRALERPRLDAALRAAAPERVRPDDRGPQGLSPAALENPGAPGSRRHPGGRDHDRPARAGVGQRGRDGDRRDGPRAHLQPARARDRRSQHLGLSRRRLPDGGDQPRGLLARRDARPGQADLLLGQQRDLDRRQRRRVVHRRHAQALRGLRLARRARRRRPRPRVDPRRDPRREGREGPPDAALLQDGDRHGRRDQGRFARRARGAARRRGDRRDPPAHPLAPPAVRDPGRGLQGLGRAAARREDPGRVAAALRRLRQGAPRSRGGIHAAHGRRSARGLGGARGRHAGGRRGQGRDDRHAQGLAELHRGLREGAAGADRRLGRPRRLEPHALVRLEGRHPRARGATTSTSACASSA